MAQLRGLGTPFGSPGGIINIPAPAGSALAGQIQMRAMEGLGQALGAYLGQRQQKQLWQQDEPLLQSYLGEMMASQQPGFTGQQPQFPEMQSRRGQRYEELSLQGQLGNIFGDPYGVQRTKAGLQQAQTIGELGALPAAKQAAEQTTATGLRKEFNQAEQYKNYQIIERSERGMKAALKMSLDPKTKSKVASDQALAVLFQKMLDPSSVVRESEYARTPEGISMINRMTAFIPQLRKGGLAITNEDRKALYDMSQKLLNESKITFNKHIENYKNLATNYQVDPKLVFGNIKKFDVGDTQPSGLTPEQQGRREELQRKAGL